MAKATTFEQVLAEIEKFQGTTNVAWYRGCSKLRYDLLPKIARGAKGVRKFADVRAEENRMFLEFRERASPFVANHTDDEWDNMFVMQHYGVPTRLLDWSESPFVALYFALHPRSGGYTDDPVVWMMRPEEWNLSVMPIPADEERILDKSHRRLQDYGFGRDFERYREEPLMMRGSYNSPRIVAQRGCFTIFGKKFEKLQDYIKNNKDIEDEILQSVVIDKGSAEMIFNSLLRKGITETFVYPDMEGLSLEVARKHGFGDGQ